MKYLRNLNYRKFSLRSNGITRSILILTLIHWGILFFQIPIFTSLKGWFWPFTSNPTGQIWLILFLGAIAGAVVYLVLKIDRQNVIKLCLLIFLGLSLQYGFAFLEGRGLDAITDRIVTTGHAEFARIAVQQDDIFYILSNYEDLVGSGELGVYARSKPPGQLFFYMLTKEIGEFIDNRAGTFEEKLRALEFFASYLWPFISYLVLVPLFFSSRIIFGSETAIVGCAFFLMVPSVNLITLHTDQVLFPLLFMTSILFSLLAFEKNNIILAFVSGLSIYVFMWFSFVIGFVLPIIVPLGYFFMKGQNDKHYHRHLLSLFFFIALGILSADVLFRLVFDYDILLRYENAIQHHIAWKNWVPSLDYTLYFAILNLIEYFVWLGMPVSILVVESFRKAVKSVFQRKVTLGSIYTPVLVGVILIIAFMGRTQGEVARLWLFLVPLVCTSAAHIISGDNQEVKNKMIWLVVILQLGTTYLTKVYQDFW